MPEKFQNKYRIASARLQHWDYGWNAAYFVTICTKDRVCYFGDIITRTAPVETQNFASLPPPSSPLPQQQMQLSEIGQIANDYWLEIPNHFPFVKLGDHIVMPNHVHGIVIIDKPDDGRDTSPQPKNQFGPQSQNLASIIRGYKSGVKKYATINQIDFTWQPRFHDHIIRDEKSFDKISNYIRNNPLNWSTDQFR